MSEVAVELKNRIVALEAGHNFRDIGGYKANNGQRVHKACVYRSGTLANITTDDQLMLATMGIRVVCDFRTNDERLSKPTQWHPDSSTDFWSQDYSGSVANLVHTLSQPSSTPEGSRDLMTRLYRELPFEQAVSYREMFLRIANGELPLVFHCSVGKDRTGVAAALLLSHIGVSRDIIFEDYLITEQFFEQGCRLISSGTLGATLARVDSAIWEPIIRAESAYLTAMFDEIETRFVSVNQYLQQELGLNEQTLQKVCDHLLTNE